MIFQSFPWDDSIFQVGKKLLVFFRENLSPGLFMGKNDRKSSEIPTGERPNLSLFGESLEHDLKGLQPYVDFVNLQFTQKKSISFI